VDKYQQRFGGIERLVGKKAFSHYRKSHIAVIGVGGVGSWAAEGLVRSGIGELTIIDLDEVCITNINRQLPATDKTIGHSKVNVLAKRFLEINPELIIHAIEDFYTKENSSMLLSPNFDVVIDAVDGLPHKCELAVLCKERHISLVTCGGAAGKIDPTQIISGDLGDAIYDRLLKRMRKQLRQECGFPAGEGKLGISAVFSSEIARYPLANGETCLRDELPPGTNTKNLDCQEGLGSASFVTASFGMTAAKLALDLLISNNETLS
jgi:tRNA threonylcarbamoyladenosine dehydratase